MNERDALKAIAALDYRNAAVNCAAYEAVKIASAALASAPAGVPDEWREVRDGKRVPIPKNADQAQLMVGVGIAWLEENAPARLRNAASPPPQATAPADQPQDQHSERTGTVFELWWADYMPEATRDHAWAAYSAALPPEGADEEDGAPAPAPAGAMEDAEHAVLRYQRSTPGHENDMPVVVSCNWLPDGDYPVYLDAARQAGKGGA